MSGRTRLPGAYTKRGAPPASTPFPGHREGWCWAAGRGGGSPEGRGPGLANKGRGPIKAAAAAAGVQARARTASDGAGSRLRAQRCVDSGRRAGRGGFVGAAGVALVGQRVSAARGPGPAALARRAGGGGDVVAATQPARGKPWAPGQRRGRGRRFGELVGGAALLGYATPGTDTPEHPGSPWAGVSGSRTPAGAGLGRRGFPGRLDP